MAKVTYDWGRRTFALLINKDKIDNLIVGYCRNESYALSSISLFKSHGDLARSDSILDLNLLSVFFTIKMSYNNIYIFIMSVCVYVGPSWSWSYGSWIYNYMYLCNQYLSPLTLWIRIPLMARCTRYNFMR